MFTPKLPTAAFRHLCIISLRAFQYMCGVFLCVGVCVSVSVCWCQRKNILDFQKQFLSHWDETHTNVCVCVVYLIILLLLAFWKVCVRLTSVCLSLSAVLTTCLSVRSSVLLSFDFLPHPHSSLEEIVLIGQLTRSVQRATASNPSAWLSFLKTLCAPSVCLSTVVQPRVKKNKRIQRSPDSCSVTQHHRREAKAEGEMDLTSQAFPALTGITATKVHFMTRWLLRCDVTTARRLLVWLSRKWGRYYSTKSFLVIKIYEFELLLLIYCVRSCIHRMSFCQNVKSLTSSKANYLQIYWYLCIFW